MNDVPERIERLEKEVLTVGLEITTALRTCIDILDIMCELLKKQKMADKRIDNLEKKMMKEKKESKGK